MSFAVQAGRIVANVTPADDGSHAVALAATQGNVTTTLRLTIQVGPVPIITINPNPIPAVPDNTPAGTQIATYAVTMSDGSPFTGTVALTSNP